MFKYPVVVLFSLSTWDQDNSALMRRKRSTSLLKRNRIPASLFHQLPQNLTSRPADERKIWQARNINSSDGDRCSRKKMLFFLNLHIHLAQVEMYGQFRRYNLRISYEEMSLLCKERPSYSAC